MKRELSFVEELMAFPDFIYLNISLAMVLNGEVNILNFTDLHKAALYGEKKRASKLVEDAHNVNAKDVTGNRPLYWALKYKNWEIVKLIFEAQIKHFCQNEQIEATKKKREKKAAKPTPLLSI